MAKVAAYILGQGTFLGHSAPLPDEADSIAYVCSHCGDVWGRIVVQDQPFHIVNRPCERHPWVGVADYAQRHYCGLFQWWNADGGVTSLMFHGALPRNFPSPVLRREFLIMYEHWRKQHAQDHTECPT